MDPPFPPVDAASDGVDAAPIDLAGRRLHFVGIGGCGMSGLAAMCAQRGAVCTGSDRATTPAVAALMQRGVRVTQDQSGAGMPDALNALIVSAAIAPNHPERLEAGRRGVAVLKYAQLLGLLMRGRQAAAVAGTHGKSTTTSMLAHALIEGGADPSLIIGAQCRQIGGGARVGASDVLVAEACEYDRSFHHLYPTLAAILNIEADHLDCYAGLDEIVESFAAFAERLPAHGLLLIQHELVARTAVTARCRAEVQTVGFAPQADWRVAFDRGRVALHRRPSSRPLARWRSALPGEHMAYNAAVAAILAGNLGCRWKDIERALSGFEGVDRRMQRVGRVAVRGGEALVVDDYAHHPTEIDTTLRALREHHRPGRLVCVFQPHQHSRTRFLMDQFARCFTEADRVLVPDIYFVRDSEAERQAVTAEHLVDRLCERGTDARYLGSFEAIAEALGRDLRPGDLIVTMGAGDVWRVGRTLVDGGVEAVASAERREPRLSV